MAASAPAPATQTLPLFVVDAFASAVFRGNPAAVVALGARPFPPDAVLQAIAAENNLAETAFTRHATEGGAAGDARRLEIRFFTPEVEIDLCGHAPLASAFVAFSELGEACESVTFVTTRAGVLTATRRGARIELDFPSRPPAEVQPAQYPEAAIAALGGARPLFVGKGRDWLLVFESEQAVRDVRLDFSKLQLVTDAVVVIATAAADAGSGKDFVCRAFCPGCPSVPEDPVCGSAHCALIPFWAAKLGKDKLVSHQVSRRFGELHCELVGDRVRIAGTAVQYLKGEITVPA